MREAYCLLLTVTCFFLRRRVKRRKGKKKKVLNLAFVLLSMSEWDRYTREAALNIIRESQSENHYLHSMEDVFNPNCVHNVITKNALTIGQIACAFVNLIYGSGTGRKASRSLKEHQELLKNA